MNQIATQPQFSSVETRFRAFAQCCRRLIARSHSHFASAHDFPELRRSLESLPIASDEFGRALCHLNNAWRYVMADEYGAASWELSVLARKVRVLEELSSACLERRFAQRN